MAQLMAEVSVDVARGKDDVWFFLANPSNMPKWVSGVLEAKSDGVAKKGSKFSVKYKYGGKTNDITFEVNDADAGKKLSYKTIKGSYPIVATITLDQQGNATKLNYHQTAMSDGKFTAFTFIALGWAIRPQVRRMLKKDLAKAKAAIEVAK